MAARLFKNLLNQLSGIDSGLCENGSEVIIKVRLHCLESVVVVKVFQDSLAARVLSHGQHAFHDHLLKVGIEAVDELHTIVRDAVGHGEDLDLLGDVRIGRLQIRGGICKHVNVGDTRVTIALIYSSGNIIVGPRVLRGGEIRVRIDAIGHQDDAGNNITGGGIGVHEAERLALEICKAVDARINIGNELAFL